MMNRLGWRMKIVLGVVDVAYAGDSPPQKVSAKKGKPVKPAAVSHETTGQVARYLEDKYAIMQTFADAKKDMIRDAVVDSLRGELSNILAGGPVAEQPLEAAFDVIAHEFREFLDHEEIAGLGVPGVPTRAALRGDNPRLKSRRGPRRPSFIASGLYQSSFKCWSDK